MENIVDRIRILCRKYGTSVTKLEKELGYANGTIGKWRNSKRRPSLEKVLAIAERFGVTSDYLYEGTEAEKKPTTDGEHEITFDDFSYALYNESKDLPPEKKQMLLEMARFMKADLEKEKKIDGHFVVVSTIE